MAVAAVLAASAGAANAKTIDWTVENGKFSDGATFAGTFVVNTTLDAITSWDIVTSNSTYSSSNPFSLGAGDLAGHPAFENYVPPIATSLLTFTDIPFSGEGVVSKLTGRETLLAFGVIPVGSRRIVAGDAFGLAVPEPATWAMMMLGLSGAGLMLRRRSRALATAA